METLKRIEAVVDAVETVDLSWVGAAVLVGGLVGSLVGMLLAVVAFA